MKRVAIVGYGNIGRFVLEALQEAPDFEIAGVVRRSTSGEKPLELTPYKVVTDIKGIIWDLHESLGKVAKANNTVSIISAGWDPGSDSVIRTLLEAAAPKGLTWTNLGSGMSMGHSVVARSKKGVKNALSMTMPKGSGVHNCMVYVELEEGLTAQP